MASQVLENAELNIREMQEKKTVLSSLPFKLFVEPTQRCNLRCFMCWDERRREKDDLDLALLEKIESELFPTAAEVDFFLVGEPMLCKNLPVMIEKARDYTFLPKIFTNATVFKEDFYRRLVELGFFVNISTDAATPALFESIRKGAKFEVFVANLRKLVALGQEIGNERFHVRLCATIGSYNLGEVPGIIELAHELGIRDVMVNDCDMGPPHPFNMNSLRDYAKAILGQSLTRADELGIRFSFPRYIGEAELLARNHNWDDFHLPIDDHAPDFLERFNPVGGDCPYPWNETVIRCDGTVASCCQKLIPMGDLNRRSFKDIWNNREYRKLRRQKQFFDCQGYCLLTRNSVWKGEAFR